jgi:hypothetical protein
MILPRQSAGVLPGPAATESDDGVLPQISCRIGDIYGTRTKRECRGPRWARVCVNVPEFKQGACVSEGANCEDCFARCKDQFTSAGGWSIKSTGTIKCPN